VAEEVEVEGKTAMDLYTTLGSPACSLRVRSSSDGLGRPRGLGSHRQPITRIGNRGFLMQAFRLIFYLSSKMRLSTADHEILIGNALAYFKAHKESVSMQKVILLFGVHKGTFFNRLHNKTKSITTISGQNKLLTDIEQLMVITYYHRQAYARFPCTY
jgi:hypothetical protein